MKTELTDDLALATLKQTSVRRTRVATKFVPRTIVYPVAIEYQPGVQTVEIRTFVRMAEYCSESQWEKALQLEKKYAKLNKEYQAQLKAAGQKTSAKEPGNPLKATLLNVR